MLITNLLNAQAELAKITHRRVSVSVDADRRIHVFIGGANAVHQAYVTNYFEQFASRIETQHYPNSVKVSITIKPEYIPAK